ncbi:LysR family transcriptional regulator [Acidiferrimicrobium sp. IK]|uniref:LysR family transcriptional regulator n=1 Tax=Acidiferrimicrobium sp. IK TaxID=2871700 RepID=UPI0021CB2D4C|nr:LysR family transcriptional regulator [Acidiferrimicrobium sp. IK]MCU4186764.1 LysR family transcriptional regulator [Acidiferrimicrobium sp. IK]
MTLRRLEYFVAVADEGSFTGAARALHMAQPPLSTQVRALEKELGLDLFDRDRRRATLTAAGQALLPEARALLERYRLLPQLARRAATGETGRLTIGIIPSAANGALPLVLRGLQQRHPGLELALVEDRPDDLMRRLDTGQLDVVLHYSPPEPPHYLGRVLAEDRLVVALPSGHPLTARSNVSLAALNGEPLILPRRHGGEGLYERITRLLADHGVRPSVTQGDIWLLQTIIGLVAAGAGVAIVPETVARSRSGDVEYRPVTETIPALPLVAVWRADSHLPTVQRFVDEWGDW